MTDWPGTPVQQSQWPGTPVSTAPKTGMEGAADEVSQRFNKGFSLSDPSLIGAAGSLYRGARALPAAAASLYHDASDLGAGRIDPSTPEGADKAVGVASAVLPMSPASTIGRTIAAPSRQALHNAENADYTGARAIDARITPDAGSALADTIATPLQRHFDPADFPGVYRQIDRLRKPSPGINDVAVGTLDDVHSALGNLGEVPGNSAAVARARAPIRDYMEAIPPGDVASGDAQGASELFARGRGNSAGGFRSDAIQGVIKRGENQSKATGTHANEGNAVRQGANRLVNSGDFRNGEDRLYGFTPEETDALNGAVTGSPVTNAARLVAKKVGSPFLWGPLAGGAVTAGELGHFGPAAALAGAAGTSLTAQKIADMLAKRPLKQLDEATRLRTPLGQSPRPGMSSQSAASPVAAMIAGLTARQNQQQ